MKYFLYLFLFFVFGFFGLYYEPTLIYNVNRAFGILILILWIVWHFRYKSKVHNEFQGLMSFYLALFLWEFVYSYITYSDDFTTTFLFCSCYFIVLGYYIVNGSSYYNLTDLVCRCATLTVASIFIQYVIYDILGKEPLIHFSQLQTRMGIPRLFLASTAICYAAVISFGQIIKYKNMGLRIPKSYILACVTSLFYIVFFVMTRAVVVIILCTFLLMYLLCYKGNKLKNVLMLLFLLIIGSCVFSSIISNYQEFNSDDENDSLSIRFMAISYYVDQVIEHNFLTGLGFIRGTNTQTSILLGGREGLFYREDVGFFGFLHIYGLVGAIWLFLVFRKMYKKCVLIFSNKLHYFNSDFIGLFVLFFLCQMTTNNIVDYGSIQMLPLLFLLFERKIITSETT